MNISLKEVNSNNDIKTFGEYKVELIKFHQEYAEKLGLFDKVVDNYNFILSKTTGSFCRNN